MIGVDQGKCPDYVKLQNLMELKELEHNQWMSLTRQSKLH